MTLQDRTEALKRGRYIYQGKPCPHGHSGRRYATDHHCVQCAIDKAKRRNRLMRAESNAAEVRA